MRHESMNTWRPFTGAIMLAGGDPQVVGLQLLLLREVRPSDLIFGSISIDMKDGGVWLVRNGENCVCQ